MTPSNNNFGSYRGRGANRNTGRVVAGSATNPVTRRQHQVGELRPSQLLFTYGVGSIVDLPFISAMVMGLEDWESHYSSEIKENRLLAAVRSELGYEVQKLRTPPSVITDDEALSATLADNSVAIGVPVTPFPQWLLCPRCRYLAPVDSGLFELKVWPRRADMTQYVHKNCPRTQGRPPAVVPARFLVACEGGHIDDFPWVYFVHGGETDCRYVLALKELSASGEAAAIQVECTTCGKKRRMSEAFGAEGRRNLPAACGRRRPHLRDVEEGEECPFSARAISLGASNSWFPIILSALAVPTPAPDRLATLITSYWDKLSLAQGEQNIGLLRMVGAIPAFDFTDFTDAQIWEATERYRRSHTSPLISPASGAGNVANPDTASNVEAEVDHTNLKLPEWRVLSKPETVEANRDFRAVVTPAPVVYANYIKQVVLVERLREVQALTGFTRIESPSNYTNLDEVQDKCKAPLSRTKIGWVPAAEVRGEGIFIEFDENAIQNWVALPSVREHERTFRQAHRKWRARRRLEPPASGFPGMRYILLHSFSHALMRQLSLECGYSPSSIRERIYSMEASEPDGPMAGVLLYTAASDSEGTLGGLVSLGSPEELVNHIDQALDAMGLCASDPLCAEHAEAENIGEMVHAAACHACLFAPETSCERGNKYLDRSVLIPTVQKDDVAFFNE